MINQPQLTEEDLEEQDWQRFKKRAGEIFLPFLSWLCDFGRGGWRPSFCWSSGIVIVCALIVAYVVLPMQHFALPDYYYTGLNIAMGGIISAMGIRSLDKADERRVNARANPDAPVTPEA